MSKIRKFLAEEALDTIDYSFPNYMPSEQALEFFTLMRLVQGKDFEYKTPMFHYFLVDMVFGNVKKENFPYSEKVQSTIHINPKRIAVVASRGGAKSTVLTAFLPLYLAIKGKLPNGQEIPFITGVASSAQGGARVMSKALGSLVNESEFCKAYFEEVRTTETEIELTRKGTGPKADRTFLMRNIGFSGGVRGIRDSYGRRPSMFLLDDIIPNSAAAYSKTQMNQLKTIVYSDILNALVGGNKGYVISVATPFTQGDIVWTMLTEGVYTPAIFPICEQIAGSTVEKEIVSMWPDMHPAKGILEQYDAAKASGELQSFMQERMLRISSEEERMVPEYLIKWYDNRGAIIANIDNFNLLITTDFTASNSLEGDFSGIALWAINQIDEKYLLDLWLEKSTIQGQFDALFKMIEKWQKWAKGKAIDVGVEIDGQQQVNIYALDKMKIEKNVWFNYARQKGKGAGQVGIRSRSSNGAKLDRFRAILPEFEMGRIKFPKDLENTPAMEEAMDELRKASHGGLNALHDDACFSGDTVIMMGDGTCKEIKDIVVDDTVMTFGSDSLTTITKNVIITPNQEVCEYTLSDGTVLVCTPNHRVLTHKGWKQIDTLTDSDGIITVKDNICKSNTTGNDGQKSTMGITNRLNSSKVNEDGCTSIHGVSTMENSQEGITCTTKITTKITMRLKTWSLWTLHHIQNYMAVCGLTSENKQQERGLTPIEIKQQNGTGQKKGENGIENRENVGRKQEKVLPKRTKSVNVRGAVKRLCHTSKQKMCTVIENANSTIYKPIKEMWNVLVLFAGKCFNGISINPHAQKNVRKNSSNVHMKAMSKSLSVNTVVRHLQTTSARLMGFVQWPAHTNTGEQKKQPNWGIENVGGVENYLKLNEEIASSVHLNVVDITIIKKKPIGSMDVYNFEAVGTHNYVLGNGSVVHNCDLISQIGMIDYYTPTGGDTPISTDKIDTSGDLIWSGVIDDEESETSPFIF